jgi:uncharacterized protein YggU (UPF0235/DUF167 family)
MKISVKVKTRSREEKVEKIDDLNFVVRVKELPVENRANEAIIEILAEYFSVPKSKIDIIYGYNSKNKIIEIR